MRICDVIGMIVIGVIIRVNLLGNYEIKVVVLKWGFFY